LITDVYTADSFEADVMAVAGRLAAGPTRAYAVELFRTTNEIQNDERNPEYGTARGSAVVA